MTPIEALKKLAEHQFSFCLDEDNVDFLRFLIAEAAFSAVLRDKMNDWHERGSRTLESSIRAAQSAGALRAGDVRVAALFLSDVIGAPGQALVWGAKDPLNGREAGEFFDERWSAFLTIWGVESVPVA
jgi:hypothetical protein